jgi:hypothetical protein
MHRQHTIFHILPLSTFDIEVEHNNLLDTYGPTNWIPKGPKQLMIVDCSPHGWKQNIYNKTQIGKLF